MKKISLALILFAFIILPSGAQSAISLASKLKGRILLQVESRGEAWYINPATLKRIYLADGNSAYQLLRENGLGITNKNLAKIPIGIEQRYIQIDTDNDGLPDKLEEAIGTDVNNPDTDGDGYNDGQEVLAGYNAFGSGKIAVDKNLVNKLRGNILLQVESKGEAWYVNPVDGKRYYMKDGEASYQIMRYLGLGIKNNNLTAIPIHMEDVFSENIVLMRGTFEFIRNDKGFVASKAILEDPQIFPFSRVGEANTIIDSYSVIDTGIYLEVLHKDNKKEVHYVKSGIIPQGSGGISSIHPNDLPLDRRGHASWIMKMDPDIIRIDAYIGDQLVHTFLRPKVPPEIMTFTRGTKLRMPALVWTIKVGSNPDPRVSIYTYDLNKKQWDFAAGFKYFKSEDSITIDPSNKSKISASKDYRLIVTDGFNIVTLDGYGLNPFFEENPPKADPQHGMEFTAPEEVGVGPGESGSFDVTIKNTGTIKSTYVAGLGIDPRVEWDTKELTAITLEPGEERILKVYYSGVPSQGRSSDDYYSITITYQHTSDVWVKQSKVIKLKYIQAPSCEVPKTINNIFLNTNKEVGLHADQGYYGLNIKYVNPNLNESVYILFIETEKESVPIIPGNSDKTYYPLNMSNGAPAEECTLGGKKGYCLPSPWNFDAFKHAEEISSTYNISGSNYFSYREGNKVVFMEYKKTTPPIPFVDGQPTSEIPYFPTMEESLGEYVKELDCYFQSIPDKKNKPELIDTSTFSCNTKTDKTVTVINSLLLSSTSDSYKGDLLYTKNQPDKSFNWHFFKDKDILKNLQASKILDIYRFEFYSQENLEKMYNEFSGNNDYKPCTVQGIDGICDFETSRSYFYKGNVVDVSRTDYIFPGYQFNFVFKKGNYLYVVEFQNRFFENLRVKPEEYPTKLYTEKEITDAIPADYYIDMEKSKTFIDPFLTYALRCSS